MLPFRLKRAASTLLAALCLLAPARAQQQQQPARPAPQQDDEDIVRVNTQLVQTDVMVFDKSGKFIEGLKPEQFELKVDGRETPISFFDRVQAGAVNEDAQLAAARGLKSPAGGGVLPLDRGRTVLFFVDDLHLGAGSSMRMRKTLLRFIDEELGQNDWAAVVSASGQVGFLQQFTDEKVVLRAAASRINPRVFDTRDGQYPMMSEAHALAVERRDPSVLGYFVDALLKENPYLRREQAEGMVAQRANIILTQSRGGVVNTLASLLNTVRGTAQLPGRKLLFFISDGFVVEDRGNELRDWMRRVTDAAGRAGVVIYSLDAEGLRTGMPDASMASGFDPSGRLSMTDFSEGSLLQAPLHTLALDTGGRALVNTNALNRAVAGALKETSVYYLLAWKPEAAPEGGAPKYRKVDVAVRGRPELRVIVRRGFFDRPPPEEPAKEKKKKEKEKPQTVDASAQKQPPAERELNTALREALPRVGLPTSLALGYVSAPDAQGQGLLTASIEVENSALTYEQGEQPHATFDAVGVVLDDKGKSVNGFKQQLDVRPAAGASMAGQHVVFSSQMRVPPGLYQVRVAPRDTASGRVGSAMRWVEIPEFKQGRLSLSSIFLGERKSSVRPEEMKPEDLARGVVLSVGRRFAHTSWIRLTTFVYNAAPAAGSKPDVALQIQVFRDDQPVFTAPLIKLSTDGVPDLSRIPYTAELGLASFPSGRYVLQVTAIDRSAKTTATQRTSFVVE
ncbi:MAG TPA: VWA domain-containing protein [Pyrinomonadaceae bacterium]|nr:VWA domain-containing protein [Pyrinomonadaceae bacterium]